VERRVPIEYRGNRVGALGIPGDVGRTLAPDRRALLDDLAGSAGVVLHNASLSIELEHRLRGTEQQSAEIRASRWRIVAAQDSERRELERDLHDGAQPGLTAVRLSLGLLAHLVKTDNRAAAQDALDRLRDQITGALAGLRQTLRGLDPPALSQHGLVAALREQAEALGCAAQFQIAAEARAARFDPVVEAAVYFCCAEALQNAVKHCPDAPVTLSLGFDPQHGRLSFAVTDRGPGFHPAASQGGSGLQNMADRVEAVGGAFHVESISGQGTEVAGWVPAVRRADTDAASASLRPEPVAQAR
jgi:signal transduction histidine kinase